MLSVKIHVGKISKNHFKLRELSLFLHKIALPIVFVLFIYNYFISEFQFFSMFNPLQTGLSNFGWPF